MSSDETGTPRERILFLARAESRVRIMESLVESGTATQRELRTRLDASRTTVARALRSLEEQGWVENDGGTYRLTRVGAIVADRFGDLLETMRAAEELSSFLRWFPADLDAPAFLAASDVTVTASSDGDPYAPARRQAEILRDADRLRILLPSIDREATEVISERVTDHGLEAETVVSPALEATVESPEFAPLMREMLETDRSTLFVSPAPVPCYLGLAADGRVQVGVEDDEGFPRALLETTDGRIGEWADGLYREYRERARHKPVAEFE